MQSPANRQCGTDERWGNKIRDAEFGVGNGVECTLEYTVLRISCIAHQLYIWLA